MDAKASFQYRLLRLTYVSAVLRGYRMVNSSGPTRCGRRRGMPVALIVVVLIAGLAIALPTAAAASSQAITSGNAATATAGSQFSFTVTTTGVPLPSIKKVGRLPKGLTLTDNHNGTATLAGTPNLTTGGAYPRPIGGVYGITVVAAYGVDATKRIVIQAFTLTVDQAPAITSRATKSARVGASFRFTVKTRGYPKPTIGASGELPTGVTLTNRGDGKATMAGTPAPTSTGTYPITIIASNGVGTPASQHFTLTVRRPRS